MRTKFWIVVTVFLLAVGSVMTMNVEASGTNNGKGKGHNPYQNSEKVKSVIVMIGDGMGPSYTMAYRYMKDDPATPDMETTVFDDYLTGRR